VKLLDDLLGDLADELALVALYMLVIKEVEDSEAFVMLFSKARHKHKDISRNLVFLADEWIACEILKLVRLDEKASVPDTDLVAVKYYHDTPAGGQADLVDICCTSRIVRKLPHVTATKRLKVED